MEEGRARPSNECIEWDALDRLTAVSQGPSRTEFTYNSEGHRIRIVEKGNGVIQSERSFLWLGRRLAEERDAIGAVAKRYLVGGIQQDGTSHLTTTDHLGSVRELTDSAGALRARYAFDPFGRRTKTAGDTDADLGYAGTFAHGASGLTLAVYRSYDASLGRWTNQDPAGLAGGLNQYGYVGNNPISRVDPLGLSWNTFMSGFATGLLWGVGIGLLTAVFPVLAVPAMILGALSLAYGLYQIHNSRCEDEIHEILGGMFGGFIGGWGGNRFGAKASATFPGNRPSTLPDYEPIDPDVYHPRVYTRAAQNAAQNAMRGRRGPNLHDFPLDYDADILLRGRMTFGQDDYYMCELPGTHSGMSGNYQIGAQPSTGRITHRFFNPE